MRGLRKPSPELPGGALAQFLVDLATGSTPVVTPPLTASTLELAVRHGLIGVMADAEDDVIRAAARPIYARLLARQTVMERNLERILISLHTENVPATVLKGPHLSRGIYHNPHHRTFTDVDLLVPASHVELALEVLSDDAAVASIPPKTPKADKRNVPMTDPSGISFNLDLHWDLFSYTQLRGCASGATEWAWENGRLSEEHPLGPLWELPAEAMISFLGTHAVLDHRFRLILFRDLAEVAADDPGWDRLVEFAERWQLRSTTYVALLLAAQVAAAPIRRDVLDALRPSSLPVRAVEKLLETTDVVQFDGHQVHPLNLAMVLLHDDAAERLRLLAQAPIAFPGWMKRVGGSPALVSGRRQPRSGALDRSDRADSKDPLTLHVLPIDLARGAQRYAEALARSLDGDLGRHRTMTIFDSEPVALHADFELQARPGWGRKLGFNVVAARRLRNALRQLDPEVVVAHGGESLKYVAMTAPNRTKIVYYKIGTSRRQLAFPLRRLAYRTFVRRCDLVAGVSPEMVTEAIEVLGLSQTRGAYAPNGRNPEAFSGWEGSQHESVQLVFVGHVTRTKRPERFVEVIRRLVAMGDDVRGVVVGDGPMLEEIRRASLDLPIDVLGRRNDVPRILATSDAFVFTSVEEGEGMPGVLIEAALTGLPIITTDVPGARSVVSDGVSGFVVSIDDLDELVGATRRLVHNAALRRQMGEAGRMRSLEHFTLQASVDEWRRLLVGLSTDPAGPVSA